LLNVLIQVKEKIIIFVEAHYFHWNYFNRSKVDLFHLLKATLVLMRLKLGFQVTSCPISSQTFLLMDGQLSVASMQRSELIDKCVMVGPKWSPSRLD